MLVCALPLLIGISEPATSVVMSKSSFVLFSSPITFIFPPYLSAQKGVGTSHTHLTTLSSLPFTSCYTEFSRYNKVYGLRGEQQLQFLFFSMQKIRPWIHGPVDAKLL